MVDVDVVVVGSGAGGLAAAVALAQAGKKVLVLEQHEVPGGWTHSFTLGGYRFSPGVHYIGELQEGGRMRAIYEGLGVSGDLDFCELNPDGYDHVVIGHEKFDIPRGRSTLEERLARRFPAEARGIGGYLDDVEGLCRELGAFSSVTGPLDAVKRVARSPHLARWGFRTTAALINHHVRDPMLRAVLAAQSGDHGLPPSLAPAPVHASVAGHYFDGGWYPRGGAYVIPRAFVRALRRAGSDIRLSAPVSRILLENGTVLGVRLADGTEIRAGAVLSNADPHVTFTRLMRPEDVPTSIRARLALTKYSVSALSLFMAADMDLRAAGLDSGNVWHYANTDVEAIYRHGMTAWGPEQGEVPGMFLTVTTLKDPSKMVRGHHTMEAFAFVNYDTFSRWADTRYGARPESYARLKEELMHVMLRSAERIVPGLRDHLVFKELATPLSNEHYVNATRGNLYGTEKSRLFVGPLAYPVRTAVPGLWMCGASTLGHGVMGATFSGLVAAGSILRCRLRDLLGQKGPALRCYPSEHPELWPARLRTHMHASPAEHALA
ncbi:MAG: NAD(P)/FAD-dependent oxidoreductase [Deltaproteobacteria bacterium]|nr:NAD(P)/FAD-dependent oxidoreductase [Deltaproteobacteria bacterium]